MWLDDYAGVSSNGVLLSDWLTKLIAEDPSLVSVPPKKGRGKAARIPEPVVEAGPVKGEVSVTFQGRGTPEDLARFFLSLSKAR